MWLVKRTGPRNGDFARLVRYSLLTLIIFMLVCTTLAIILVSFASDYSAALHDRTQGIVLILVLIALNYWIGLVAVWRSSVLLLWAFGLADLFLCGVCVLATHQGHHIGNLGALSVFGASGVLALLAACNTCAERRALSLHSASVQCYHHVPDDWYDYGSTSQKDDTNELITNQLLLPYNANCNCVEEGLAVTLTPSHAATFCTVETNERHFLKGDRYAV